MTYKKSGKQYQGKADRITLKDFVQEGNDLNDEDRLELLREKLRNIELGLTELNKNDPRRKLLGKQKYLLSEEIHKLRTQPKRVGIQQCFMDAAYNLLIPEVFNKIHEEANYIHDIRNKGQQYNAISRRTELQIQKALKEES